MRESTGCIFVFHAYTCVRPKAMGNQTKAMAGVNLGVVLLAVRVCRWVWMLLGGLLRID